MTMTRSSRSPEARRARMEAVLSALSDTGLTAACIASAVEIPQPTVRDLLSYMAIAGTAHAKPTGKKTGNGVPAYLWYRGPNPDLDYARNEPDAMAPHRPVLKSWPKNTVPQFPPLAALFGMEVCHG